MGIKIIEESDSFIYNETNIQYGQGLIELATQDFSELRDFITQEFEHTLIRQDKAFDYVFAFLKKPHCFNNSIHFNLLLNTLMNYYEQAIEVDDYEKPFIFTDIHLDDFMRNIYHFFWQLFVCKYHIKRIIEKIDYNISKPLIDKINDLNLMDSSSPYVSFTGNNTYFISLEKSKPFPFENCEESYHFDLVFDKKGNPNYEVFFSTIQEFCNFELKAILEKHIRLAICPHPKCKKIYIKSHGNMICCSKKCTDTLPYYTNIYYKLYRNRCKYLNKIYHDPLYKKNTYPSQKLRKLYNEYKNFDNTNQQKIDEFANKLNTIQ